MVELCESNIAKTTTIIFYEDSRRICNVSTEDASQWFEFRFFLASEHVSSSTYYYWKRKYAVEKHESPIENRTLIPVTISTSIFNKTIPHSSELTVRFPNGIQVQVSAGLESSVIELVTAYPYHHVLPK